jgi:putative salt-induced outer membrane protein YdiY
MTRRPFCLAYLLILAALPAAAFSAYADEIRLLNGDRISGEIVTKAADTLTVRTQYAGEIDIRWSDVSSVSTTAPIDIMLEGADEPVRGTLQPGAGGRARIQGSDTPAGGVSLADIAYLNPKPFESGRGTSYTGRAMLSAAYASGNTDNSRIFGDAEFAARAKRYRYALTGRIDRRKEPLLEPQSAWLLGANYDRYFDEAQFGYVRGSLEHDRAKDIDRRTTAGAGYGLQVLDTPSAQLTLRSGLDYVVNERSMAADERYPALGWGIKASYLPWGPRVQLFHEQDGFWNLEQTGTVTVRSKTGIRVPLIERLNATAQLNVDWERRPAPGRVPTDRTLLLGVDYTF